MPYEELDDLPDSVKRNLPKHAREIYRAAYNSAEEQYGEEERGRAEVREERERGVGLQGRLN